jgi:hypothetical protein
VWFLSRQEARVGDEADDEDEGANTIPKGKGPLVAEKMATPGLPGWIIWPDIPWPWNQTKYASWSGGQLDWWRAHSHDGRIIVDFYPVVTATLVRTYDIHKRPTVDANLSCPNVKVSNYFIKKPNIGFTLMDKNNKPIESIGFGAPAAGCPTITPFNRTVRLVGNKFDDVEWFQILPYSFTWEAC